MKEGQRGEGEGGRKVGGRKGGRCTYIDLVRRAHAF
jgi:hypothetical protein